MRKLFRFKYEPCNGTCYAWCGALPEELNKYSEQERNQIIQKMVDAHNKLCDNPEYSFGIDRDEATRMFVGHFRTPESTDTYLYSDFKNTVEAVTQAVQTTEIPKIAGNCNYGDTGSESLGQEILRACTDEDYLREHHQNCPCSSSYQLS